MIMMVYQVTHMAKARRKDGKIDPRTGIRFVVLCSICGLAYLILGNDLILDLLTILGTFFAVLIFSAIVDPQWFLGTVVRPIYKYLTKKYYDIWLATSADEE